LKTVKVPHAICMINMRERISCVHEKEMFLQQDVTGTKTPLFEESAVASWYRAYLSRILPSGCFGNSFETTTVKGITKLQHGLRHVKMFHCRQICKR
jgi:hypothetical protein